MVSLTSALEAPSKRGVHHTRSVDGKTSAFTINQRGVQAQVSIRPFKGTRLIIAVVPLCDGAVTVGGDETFTGRRLEEAAKDILQIATATPKETVLEPNNFRTNPKENVRDICVQTENTHNTQTHTHTVGMRKSERLSLSRAEVPLTY